MNEEVSLLLNLEAAAHSLIHAQDFCPGDDLGASTRAIAQLEIRQTLNKLSALRGNHKFDAVAVSKALKDKWQ